MNFPQELKYTAEHEWIRAEGDIVTIGITDYAQKELGDIVYVEVDTVGESLDKGEVFGTVEAVKTVSDLYMPVSGEIIEKNEDLEEAPETVNANPYTDGWMVKIKISNVAELDELLSAADYEKGL